MEKSIKVIRKKLGKARLWGEADYEDDSIVLDPRLNGKKELEIIIHEAIHILRKDVTEEETERISIALTHLLWDEGFRKVDNRNDIPLQDGSL